jgi:hypothetical protein
MATRSSRSSESLSFIFSRRGRSGQYRAPPPFPAYQRARRVQAKLCGCPCSRTGSRKPQSAAERHRLSIPLRPFRRCWSSHGCTETDDLFRQERIWAKTRMTSRTTSFRRSSRPRRGAGRMRVRMGRGGWRREARGKGRERRCWTLEVEREARRGIGGRGVSREVERPVSLRLSLWWVDYIEIKGELIVFSC